MSSGNPSSPAITHRTLNVLAALVWIGGGLALLRKAILLLLEASALRPDTAGPYIAAVSGILVGGVLSQVLFRRSCRRNLARIKALQEPKLWQFYRPGFFLALAAMITTGTVLSRLAHGHYIILLAVAALDLHISIALLGSSPEYWLQKAFFQHQQR